MHGQNHIKHPQHILVLTYFIECILKYLCASIIFPFWNESVDL